MHYLTRVGHARPHARAGTRRDLFRVHEDGWGETYTQQASAARRWIEAADEGADARARHAGRPPLAETRDFFAFMHAELPGADPALARAAAQARARRRGAA